MSIVYSMYFFQGTLWPIPVSHSLYKTATIKVDFAKRGEPETSSSKPHTAFDCYVQNRVKSTCVLILPKICSISSEITRLTNEFYSISSKWFSLVFEKVCYCTVQLNSLC